MSLHFGIKKTLTISQYLLNHINTAGFRRVILSTGYMSEKIESYFKNKYKELELLYSAEDEPLGTGGAVQLAFQKVQQELCSLE